LFLGVVNLLLRVNGRVEVLQKAALLRGLAVDEDFEGLVGVDDQSVDGGDLVGAGHGGSLEVLLLVLAGLGVLVTEDEVNLDGLLAGDHYGGLAWFSYLVGGTALVGTEHDHIRGGVGELLLVELLVVLKKLQVGTTADQGVLRLDLILDNQGLALRVNLFGELGRDSVVSGRVLDNKTLVALDTLEDGRLLNGPLADVSPVLIRLGVILLRVGALPAGLPVAGELLEEGSLERGRLNKPTIRRVNGNKRVRSHTVKIGLSMEVASDLSSGSSA
jgi:hypothetical protein